MGKKGLQTTASPMKWEQLQSLTSRMLFDIENKISNPRRKTQNTKFLLIIAIGSFCGLGIGDVLGLRWIDVVDIDVLEIAEQKTNKTRSITINNNLQLLIRKARMILCPYDLGANIFTNSKDGNVMTIQYVNRKLKTLFASYNINIEKVSSHTLRKTFGRRVFEQNYKSDEALIMLSQIFNHSSTAITRRYIGLQSEKIRDVYLSL